MNDFAMAYVAVEVVKKTMRDSLNTDYRNIENKSRKKRKSIWDLF